jgi:hypothetical protein
MRKLLLQFRHKSIFLRQLLLLQADGLDKVLHDFLVILLRRDSVSSLRALCRMGILYNARGLLETFF